MHGQKKSMTAFRLAVLLAFFWNLSLGRCLVSTAFRTPTIEAKSSNLALAATSRPAEYTSPFKTGVTFEFPPVKERFRNFTQAFNFTIVHDDDDDEDPEEAALRYRRKLEELMSDHSLSSNNNSNNTMLRSFLQWCFGWIGRLKAFRLKRPRRFSIRDIGGMKRHFALLVFSLAMGLRGCPYPFMSPMEYYRTNCIAAHQQVVAALSPSSLYSANREIRISPLNRYAMEWHLRKLKRKRAREQPWLQEQQL